MLNSKGYKQRKCRWRLFCLQIICRENVWELVTAPSESLPTHQNGVENRDKAYYSKILQNTSTEVEWVTSLQS